MNTKLPPETVRMQATIKKVKPLILKENSLTQRFIASKPRMSFGTVSKIIDKDLKLKKVFKPKVHLLLPQHIAERKTNCRKLHEKHLVAEKWKFMVTFDKS
ncbi:hypothetical protein TNCV_1533631 [Trichonephila clavipes]|nr:hypothetical protein TNCV_1533631 [Trichonephila clavipes]